MRFPNLTGSFYIPYFRRRKKRKEAKEFVLSFISSPTETLYQDSFSLKKKKKKMGDMEGRKKGFLNCAIQTS